MIKVNVNKVIKPIHNFWNNLQFHPTDAIEDSWGQEILNDVSKDKVAKMIRLYTMMEDIVSLDKDGNLKYDFTLNDLRIDYLISKGFILMLDYAYLPPFLAKDPNLVSAAAKNKTRYKGKMIVNSIPKDYKVWGEICYQYTKHIVEKYGLDLVLTWRLQCWNEPDLHLFFMGNLDNSDPSLKIRAKEYSKLYTEFTNAIDRVSPLLKRGGPSLACHWTTAFIDEFFSYVRDNNIRFDYISIHTYGTAPTELNNGSLPFDIKNTLIKHNFFINNFSRYIDLSNKEIIVDEWGASSNGFYNIEECPKLIFRDDSHYAAYFGKMITDYIYKDIKVDAMLMCLSGQHEMKVDFSGFRNLFTLHHIAKPIYNAYVILSKVGDTLLEIKTNNSDLSVLASKSNNGYQVLLSYASEHFDKDLNDLNDKLEINNINGKYLVNIYLIDKNHTNPYQLFIKEKMNNDLTDEQIKKLKEISILKTFKSFQVEATDTINVDLSFTNNALCLVELRKIN